MGTSFEAVPMIVFDRQSTDNDNDDDDDEKKIKNIKMKH